MNRYTKMIEPDLIAGSMEDCKQPTFGQLWQRRFVGVELFIDRMLPYNLSTIIVYVAARLGVSPNTISILSGVTALCAFLLGLLLPASDVLMPVALIYLTAQMAYVFDCADGQLARAMGTASKFGDFLDKSVDIVSFTLIFGGYFGFLYRHLTVASDNANAEIWLLLGFLFLAARTSRFAVWQRIQFEVGDREAALTKDDGMLVTVVKNVMDMQASLFGLLLFPFAPDLCLLLFAIQTVIMAAVYVRYFIRAKHLYDN